MENNTLKLSDLHSEHQYWLKELKACKEEVKGFEERLGLISSRIEERERRAKLEHIQNQFIRQKDVIDNIRHKIKRRELYLDEYADAETNTVSGVHVDEFNKLIEEIDTFKRLYDDLKNEFHELDSKAVVV